MQLLSIKETEAPKQIRNIHESGDMSTIDKKQDEEEAMLPGFRFHPTDEELVAFYLRRKVRNKQLSIELIKQIDIYKYDPWELPTTSGGANNHQEWYFFCLRGRKYRNSVRPNRVTGSGFWKATGIDKPIYAFKKPQECIGLKKSLVYYSGSAGKGTKTDWMMHEFRLPPQQRKSAGQSHNQAKTNNIPLEADVWTVCRIFKRITSYKKYIPSQPQAQPQAQPNHNFTSSPTDYSTSKTCSNESDQINNNSSGNSEIYLNFADYSTYGSSTAQQNRFTPQSSLLIGGCNSYQQRFDHTNSAGFWNASGNGMFAGDDCDELRPVVDPYRVCLDRLY